MYVPKVRVPTIEPRTELREFAADAVRTTQYVEKIVHQTVVVDETYTIHAG